jgi:ribosomal protein S4
MTLLRWLRHPYDKPPVTIETERRLDEAEARINRVISADGARHARQIIRHG